MRRRLAERNKRTVIKPPPLRPAVAGGFTIDDFEISPDHTTMTCPAGATVELRNGRAVFAHHCQGCELEGVIDVATEVKTPHWPRTCHAASPPA